MSQQKKTLYLHIGTHKTGTTSIQMALHTHSEELFSRGIYYPPLNNFFNHHDLPVYLQSADGEQKIKNWFDGIVSTVNTQPVNSVIVSSEAFYVYRLIQLISNNAFYPYVVITKESYKEKLIKLRSLIPELFDVKVVIYLRRQDHFLESAYYQMVKGHGAYSGSTDDALEGLSVYLDYNFLLGLWSEVFGRDNIIVRVYEKQQIPDGSVKDFLQLINLPPALVEPIASATHDYNRRLSREILEYKLILNRIIEKEDPKRKDQLPYLFLERLSARPEFSQQEADLLSEEQKQNILSRYAEGNAAIARDYLKRGNGRLFYEEEQASTPSSHYPGLTVEKAVAIGTQFTFQIIDSYEAREKMNALFSSPELLDAQGMLNSLPFRILIKGFNKLKLRREYRIIKESGLFDTDFYLQNNTDVLASGMDPILHFLKHGWRELRAPNSSFDISAYLLDHPGMDRGMNPFVHFILENKKSAS